jgi:hypothetical protein
MTAKHIFQSIFIKNNKKKMEMDFFLRRWAGPGKTSGPRLPRPSLRARGRRPSRPARGSARRRGPAHREGGGPERVASPASTGPTSRRRSRPTAGSGQTTTSELAHHVRKELADSRGRLGKREKERARRWAEHGSAAPSRWRGEAAGN